MEKNNMYARNAEISEIKYRAIGVTLPTARYFLSLI